MKSVFDHLEPISDSDRKRIEDNIPGKFIKLMNGKTVEVKPGAFKSFEIRKRYSRKSAGLLEEGWDLISRIDVPDDADSETNRILLAKCIKKAFNIEKNKLKCGSESTEVLKDLFSLRLVNKIGYRAFYVNEYDYSKFKYLTKSEIEEALSEI